MGILAPGTTIYRPQFVLYPCPELLKTGQTTQYGGYADDGFYEAGVAKSYTVLTLGQYAGTTALTLNGNVENHSNNCVLDNITCLMWSRTESGANIGPANNGTLPWTTNVNGEGIFTYIAEANAQVLAGHSDWRVPNIIELYSLLECEIPSGNPDPVAFPGWTNGYTWSSSTRPESTTSAAKLIHRRAQSLVVLKTEATSVTALVRGGL